ncbi:hypothetical protein ACHAXA_010847 [Cyclostephanos tholiformis]|uniref:DUF6815 domain-containing protein n=1 Tax=Cyclostephanos tholiformis TaxID=382380 RepID=A0ABD3R4U3_9STRA
MNDDPTIVKIAILYPGDAEARTSATAESNRFASLFAEFAKHRYGDTRVHAEPAVYHPTLVDDVQKQLMDVDAALVWVNPIEDGYDRKILNDMLCHVSNAGVYVSAHPDVIAVMGTKDILVKTRHMPWGVEDTVSYDNLDDMRAGLTSRLANGEIRVLKRNIGQSGSGVWLVRRHAGGGGSDDGDATTMHVRVKHAERGSVERTMSLEALFDMLISDFHCLEGGNDDSRVIDMAYQERLPEGMVRAYMVLDKVGGFGHQAINALHPTAELPMGHPRRYYPPENLEGGDVPPLDFQPLRRKLESEWMPSLLDQLNMTSDALPVLWDADFMLGPKDPNDGSDTYVLCEINMSSVSPYPDSATPLIANATIRQALIAKSTLPHEGII